MSKAKRRKKKIVLFSIVFILIVISLLIIGLISQTMWEQDKPFKIWGNVYETNKGGGMSGDITMNLGTESLSFKSGGASHPHGNTQNTWWYYNNNLVCITTGLSQYADDNCYSKCSGSDQPPECENWDGYLINDEKTIKIMKGDHVNCLKYCYSGWPGCHYNRIDSYVVEFTDKAFEFNISYPLTSYMVGDNITITMTIKNNVMPLKGKHGIRVKTPSPLGGSFIDEKMIDEVVDINMGENIFVYEIKVTKAIDVLNITPFVEIYIPSSSFTGVLSFDSDDIYFGDGCVLKNNHYPPTLMKYGKVLGNETPIMITPQPLWLQIACDEGCPEGYSLSSTPCEDNIQFCIRDDIQELSCYQLGCPIIEGHNYQCTSAGICAETVFVHMACTTDENCTEWTGGLATKCDVGSGLCIEEHIYNEILQCNVAADCPKPCDGILIHCDEGKCVYEGECSETTFGCRQVGCPEGYTCNYDRNVCERTTFITQLKINWSLIILGGIFLAGLIVTGIGFISKKKTSKIIGLLLMFGSSLTYLLIIFL